MNHRWLASVIAALALLAGACGPSAGQVRAARAARYRADGDQLFRAVVDAVRTRHEVVSADARAGVIRTKDRWYEQDGTFEDKKANAQGVIVEDGSLVMHYDVAVVLASPGEYQVVVTPVVAQIRNGYASPFKIAPDDLAMPGWVHGKTDLLVLAIHDALERFQFAPPGAQVSQVSVDRTGEVAR